MVKKENYKNTLATVTFLIHLIYLERDRRRLMVENTAAR